MSFCSWSIYGISWGNQTSIARSRINGQLGIRAGLVERAVRSRRYCVVLTQVDQYGPYLAECRTWAEVVKRHLPQVYDFHLADGGTRIIPIAAVNETLIRRLKPSSRSGVQKAKAWKGLWTWLRQSVRSLIEESGSDREPDSTNGDQIIDKGLGTDAGPTDGTGSQGKPIKDTQPEPKPNDPIAHWFKEFFEWLDGKGKKRATVGECCSAWWA